MAKTQNIVNHTSNTIKYTTAEWLDPALNYTSDGQNDNTHTKYTTSCLPPVAKVTHVHSEIHKQTSVVF